MSNPVVLKVMQIKIWVIIFNVILKLNKNRNLHVTLLLFHFVFKIKKRNSNLAQKLLWHHHKWQKFQNITRDFWINVSQTFLYRVTQWKKDNFVMCCKKSTAETASREKNKWVGTVNVVAACWSFQRSEVKMELLLRLCHSVDFKSVTVTLT